MITVKIKKLELGYVVSECHSNNEKLQAWAFSTFKEMISFITIKFEIAGNNFWDDCQVEDNKKVKCELV